MTTQEFWKSWLAFWLVAAGPILLAAFSLAYSLYLGRRHREEIKEALKNSRYIYLWGTSLGKRGLIWSLLEISKIAGMVVWPRASLIIGELDPDDLKNFPAHLKRRLIVKMTMTITAFTWMVAAVILIKFK